MPDLAEHLLQARHNEEFFGSIDRGLYSDWAIIALYYAALHYIDAFLATVRILDPGGHAVRDPEIRQRPELQPISHHYFRLKNRSQSARYYCARFRQGELERCHRDDLGGIKAALLPLLSSSPP